VKPQHQLSLRVAELGEAEAPAQSCHCSVAMNYGDNTGVVAGA
jgi:hypothetical protein